jgi:hypothetical protein
VRLVFQSYWHCKVSQKCGHVSKVMKNPGGRDSLAPVMAKAHNYRPI